MVDGNPDNNPNVYFTYAEANLDGFDHVRNTTDNMFEFEDLFNGGDKDFDDVTVTVSSETVIEEPVDRTTEEPYDRSHYIDSSFYFTRDRFL